MKATGLMCEIAVGSHAFEADIPCYFTRIDHRWLRRAHGIADPVILRLVANWLMADALRAATGNRRAPESSKGRGQAANSEA